MKVKILFSTLLVSMLISSSSFAAPPAGAPAGTTGMCNDGSYYSGATKQGACRGHKGIKEWYADTTPATPAATPAAPKPAPVPATPAAAPAAPKPSPAPAPMAAPKPVPAPMPAPAATAAPGGGAGKVWVNTPSKVYHCEGDRWYGKTKVGEYMTESDAVAKGFHGDHGKTCSK